MFIIRDQDFCIKFVIMEHTEIFFFALRIIIRELNWGELVAISDIVLLYIQVC